MALQLLQLPTPSSSSSSSSSTSFSGVEILRSRPFLFHCYKPKPTTLQIRSRHRGTTVVYAAANGKEESVSVADEQNEEEKQLIDDPSASPQDLEYVAQIQRVLKLLKKNRNMLYNEVKLTIMIEDPREVERRRLLGIEDRDSPTRDDLVAALDDVKEGRIPENRFALQILAEEMVNWPNLEVEIEKKKPRKSLYAKATDTGVDPKVAAKRLNIDWDTAAEIEDTGESEQTDLPSAVGFGALYLVSAFPIIIGVSVVLILFYNSLQ